MQKQINKLGENNIELINYIKKNIIVYWNKQTIYPRNKEKLPKNNPENWILDFRKMFVDSVWLSLISNNFWNIYWKEFPFQIASIELWSVPLMWAILLDWQKRWFDVSWIIIRKSRKKSWLWNIIEWKYNWWKIILIDDIVNSWNTLFQSIEILRDNNINIEKIFCIVKFKNKDFDETFLNKYKNFQLDYLVDLNEIWLKQNTNIETKILIKILVEKFKILSLDNPNKVLVVPKSSPLFDGKNIYLAWEWWKIICIDKDNYKKKWDFSVNLTKRMKNILSSPIDIWENIIFWSYDWSLYCLNKETWKQVFYSSIADWIWSSADYSKEKNKIYIWLEHYWIKKGSLACVDSKNWKILWQYYVDDYIHSSPIYIKEINSVICWTNCWKLICLDADNWTQKWICLFNAPIKSWFKYVQKNNSIVFWCFDYFFYSIDWNTWKINWNFETLHIIYANPLVYWDNIFFWSIDRNFYHLDINWNLISKYTSGWRIFSEPVLYKNDYVIFCSNDMKIYFYNIKKKTTMMYIQHSERITNRVFFVNNNLYVLDFMNNFYNYDLSKLSYIKVEQND